MLPRPDPSWVLTTRTFFRRSPALQERSQSPVHRCPSKSGSSQKPCHMPRCPGASPSGERSRCAAWLPECRFYSLRHRVPGFSPEHIRAGKLLNEFRRILRVALVNIARSIVLIGSAEIDNQRFAHGFLPVFLVRCLFAEARRPFVFSEQRSGFYFQKLKICGHPACIFDTEKKSFGKFPACARLMPYFPKITLPFSILPGSASHPRQTRGHHRQVHPQTLRHCIHIPGA